MTVFCACLAVTVFILAFDDLRNNRLGQLTAALSLTLCTATILFSLVPSTALARGTVGLGGAALFYWKLWPLVSSTLFPQTQVIHGILDYVPGQTEQSALRPVQGALVAVLDTTSDPTSTNGGFTIERAPENTRNLVVFYKNKTFPLDLSHPTSGSHYSVIPADVDQKGPNEGVLVIKTATAWTLSSWINDLEVEFNVTITNNCDTATLAAVAAKGKYIGRTAKDFLEQVRDRIKARTNAYAVHTIKEGARYEIVCN